MPSKPRDERVQTAIYLERSLIERADKLATKLTRPGMRFARADVIRMASFKGLEIMEGEQERAEKTKR